MADPKFDLGKITITFFAKLALERSGQKAKDFLNQHQMGRWGEITAEEQKQNDEIIESKEKTNKQILSVYTTSFHETIWVIRKFSEEGSRTTVLLPREYDLDFDG